MATCCPLCQVNLDAYQDKINGRFGTRIELPIFYFTQLLGLALGLEPKPLGFGKEIVSGEKIVSLATA